MFAGQTGVMAKEPKKKKFILQVLSLSLYVLQRRSSDVRVRVYRVRD